MEVGDRVRTDGVTMPGSAVALTAVEVASQSLGQGVLLPQSAVAGGGEVLC